MNMRRSRNDVSDIAIMPDFLAIITDKNFINASKFKENNTAYLVPTKDKEIDELMRIQLSRLKMFIDETALKEMDLTLFDAIFSIALKQCDTALKNGVEPSKELVIWIPDIVKYLGAKKTSINERDAIINQLTGEYCRLLGIINGDRYAVISFQNENHRDNTIVITVPYIFEIIRLLQSSRKITTSKGKEYSKPIYSFLVKPEIYKVRCKHAIDIVKRFVVLIEQAGSHTPHISAETIVNENDYLMDKMMNTSSSDFNKTLKRVFGCALIYLSDYTMLEEHYEDIKLPDPFDSANIPTKATLRSTVFRFPHKGKRRACRYRYTKSKETALEYGELPSKYGELP